MPSTRPIYSTGSAWTLLQAGCPIRKSPDQRLLAATRGLSQQRYVLHRPLVPRHPPCALSSLTFLSSLDNERSCRAFGMRDEHERYRSAREDASPRRLNDAHRLGKCAGCMCVRHGATQTYSYGKVRGSSRSRRCRDAQEDSQKNPGWLAWWRWAGSNCRPPACKAGALPAELHPRGVGMVGLSGFEPETSRLSAVRSHQLS